VNSPALNPAIGVHPFFLFFNNNMTATC
jgi:hypothetical protein